MGNYNFRTVGTVFRQSLRDFPCPVTLGKHTPSFGLHRYKQGLRFIPTDDEGFIMRGDKQRLIYKGRRRSHRFSILGDTAFEYDCILEREPESNVISLLIEGAENYDFLRQPDFVPDDFLKGSYAVYKKETLVGEGTGKLCHIHRPEIIDARGRRCWGDLAVIGNELRITIPESWLAEAKYPVVVDPTIGTTTVGSQYKWDNNDPGEPLIQLFFEIQIPVNRFLVSEAINGTCTAYLYTYVSNYDGDEYGRPVLYSDNNNKPAARKSKNEGLADFHLYRGLPAGWRQTTFSTNGAISSGSYVWFGVCTEYFWEPKFDYGYKCYDDYWDNYSSIPNTYPINSANFYDNFKLSMYFTYSAAGQNYQRKLTQGVTLADSRKITGNYKRIAGQMVKAEATAAKHLIIFKSIQDTINSFDITTKILSLISRIQDVLGSFEMTKHGFLHFRNIFETLNTSDAITHLKKIVRGIYDIAENESETKTGFLQHRTISETVHVISSAFRVGVFIARIVTGLFVREYLLSRFLKAKAEFTLKSCVTREIFLESRIL